MNTAVVIFEFVGWTVVGIAVWGIVLVVSSPNARPGHALVRAWTALAAFCRAIVYWAARGFASSYDWLHAALEPVSFDDARRLNNRFPLEDLIDLAVTHDHVPLLDLVRLAEIRAVQEPPTGWIRSATPTRTITKYLEE